MSDASVELTAVKAPSNFELPLVNVVIVNYNYATFLTAAVESVFRQTYDRIECILLDNGSTDESLAVIDELASRFPAMRVVKRPDNGGQALACVEGFLATSAPYVTFLDADDVMLPDFLATHIFALLSLRIPIGFTCSDMFQTLGDDLVLGTFAALNNFVRSGDGRANDLMRSIDFDQTVLPLTCLKPIPSSAIHLVKPDQADWPWASMSAFVFRRDALNLVMHNQKLRTLHSNFDVYLARGVNMLTGSAVIDRALTIYRMHSSNIFAKHPQLAGVFNFERHGSNDHDQHVRRILIDHLFSSSNVLLKKLQSQGDFLRAARVLNDIAPCLNSLSHPHRTYLQEQFITELPELTKLVPRAQLLLWALLLRLSPLRVAILRSGTAAKETSN